MAIVQLRVDDDLKAKASSIYEKLGIDLSSAIKMFLKRSVTVNGIPFSMILDKTDNDQELVAMSIRNMNNSAEENRISDMSIDDIDQEIAEYRKQRKRSKK
ncbi:MAG: type II toxin-antitoxin system RelB/DinJ family antitoxin [Candidatus Riflebacteria bacterium]|nr:type II toxin-antitoxin system RelB/DinJ family antitoxin [Candidatus Riflebacteria bacterium]